MGTGRSINSTLGERLDRLPMPADSSFKKEDAWEKLQGRLQNKKGEKRKLAFLAGVSLPVAASLFYFLFLFGNNKTEQAKTEKDPTTQPGVATTPVQKTEPVNKSIAIVPAKKLASQPTINRKKVPQVKLDDHSETVATVPVITAPADTFSSQNTVAVVPLAKKKLRVVHNNELGGSAAPEMERNAMASTGTPRRFPGFRKPGFSSFEEIPNDTITKQKSKRSLLPFSSLVSQKE